MGNNHTVTKAHILQALETIENQIAGIRYLLGQATIPDIVIDEEELPDTPVREGDGDGRIFTFLGC